MWGGRKVSHDSMMNSYLIPRIYSGGSLMKLMSFSRFLNSADSIVKPSKHDDSTDQTEPQEKIIKTKSNTISLWNLFFKEIPSPFREGKSEMLKKLIDDDQKMLSKSTDLEFLSSSSKQFKTKKSLSDILYEYQDKNFKSISAQCAAAIYYLLYIFKSAGSNVAYKSVYQEISRICPGFDPYDFVALWELKILPGLLEALTKKDMDLVKSFCTPYAFEELSNIILDPSVIHLRPAIIDIFDVDMVNMKIERGVPHVVLRSIIIHDLHDERDGKPHYKGFKESTVMLEISHDTSCLDPIKAWRIHNFHNLFYELYTR